MKQIHIHIVISGNVQGVGFRAGALHKAQSLNLKGFVKNLDDGSVEIEVEGDRNSLNDFVAWCHEGTMLSQVDTVSVTEEVFQDYAQFTIRKN